MRSIRSLRNLARLASSCLVLLLVGCGSPSDPPEPEAAIGVEEGNRPPALTGTLATGEPFTLEHGGNAPRVLVFYRSAQCGLCQVQLRELQRNLPSYEAQGVRVVGITLDPPETSAALAEEMGISVPLVSVDRAVFAEWAVIDRRSDVPLPATYVLDGAGLIYFRHIGRNASDRMSDAGLITILEGVRES